MDEPKFSTGNTASPASLDGVTPTSGYDQPVSSYASPSVLYPVESLEVREPGQGGSTTGYAQPGASSIRFSKRKAFIVSAAITLVVTLLTGASLLTLSRRNPDPNTAANRIPTQGLRVNQAADSLGAPEFTTEEQSLLTRGNLITRGGLVVSNSGYVSILRPQSLSANRDLNLPDSSGTICLDSNNCAFATANELAALEIQLGQISVPEVPPSVVLNGQVGQISVQGSTNRISVTTTNGLITLTTPQDLDANANIQFGNLTLGTGGTIRANNLLQTGAGSNVSISAGNDVISFVAGGRTFTFPASGPGSQLICTDGVSCASGGGQAVLLSPTSVQNDVSADSSIFINDTGGGQLIRLQQGGVDRLTVAGNGNTTISGSLTLSALGNGVVRSSAGTLTVGQVSLATEVSGTLPVANGGTGVTSAPTNGQLLIGNGTGYSLGAIANNGGLTVSLGAGSIGLAVNYGSTANTAVQGNTQLTVTAGNGLGGGGTVTLGTGGSVSLNVTYGSAANTAVQGNVQITCPAGTGNLSGGGTTITLGTGGSCAAIDTVNNPTFSTSVSTPLVTNTGNLSLTAAGAGNDLILTAADQIRLTGFNCTGNANGGVLTTDASGNISCANDDGAAANGITGTGTQNRLSYFDTTGTIADSWLLQNGSTLQLDNTRNLQLLGGNLTLTGGNLSVTGNQTTSGTVTFSALTNGFLEVNGSGLVSVGTIDLSTDTNGIYVASITAGNGISGSSNTEGGTPTIALGNLTADWVQSGAFDIVMDNAGAEVRIRESSGAFYGIFDVGDLSQNETYTFLQGGDVVTSGNVSTYATTAVTAGSGLTGGGTVGALSLNIGAGNGISVNADDIAVVYGSAANTAVQGNTQITVSAGTNITGGGTITLGSGGSVTVNVANSPTFSGTVTVQGANVTVGTTSQSGSLILNDGSSNTGTLQTAALGQNTTYTLIDPGQASVNICLSTGNCSGAGGGVTTAGGTTNRVPIFSGAQTLADSWLIQNGSALQLDAARDFELLGGNLIVDGDGSFTGDVIVDGTVTFSGLASGFLEVNGSGVVSVGTINLGADTAGDYVANIGTLTGLSTAGNSGEGSTPALSVLYGSTANTAVQGNTQITVSAGTNITGGGTITLGSGGSVTVNVANSPTFSGTLTVQGASATIGTTSQAGSLILNDGSTNTGTVQTAALGQNTTYTLIDPGQASVNICLSTGNCSGAGGGVTTAGGTANQVAKFTGASTIGDSTITDDGTNVSISGDFSLQGGDITLGSGTGSTGSLILHDNDGVGSETITLTLPNVSTSYTLILPTAVGSTNQCLKAQNGTGTLFWDNCTGGAGGASGVTSVNTLDGDLVLQGTANQVAVNDNGTDTITLSLPQNIHTGATPSFAGLTLTGNLQMNNNTIQGGTSAIDFTNFDVTAAGNTTIGGTLDVTGNTDLAGTLAVGTTNAFTIAANGDTATAGTLSVTGNVTVGAGSTLRLTGGNTAGRPGVPAEGMMYFDTDTDKLLIYSNGKWQAMTGEYLIVAASNSSQAIKDAAHYVADGNTGAAADGDQVQINAALSAAAGGKVYLAEGTYVADATILLPNNTSLVGAGRGTLIELADLDADEVLIENTDNVTGTGVIIRDVRIDGRKDLNTINTQDGIYLIGMGSGTGSSAIQGAKLTNVIVSNFRGSGITLDGSSNNTLIGTTSQANTEGIVLYNNSNNNTLTNNNAQGNTVYGLSLISGANNNTLTGNTSQGNGDNGFMLISTVANNTLTGNTSQGNGGSGFSLNNSSTVNNTLTGNTAQGNTFAGISLAGALNNTVSGNTTQGNSNGGIYLTTSSGNSITGNTSHSNTFYGIVLDVTSTNNTLIGNNLYSNGSSGITIRSSSSSNIATGNKIHDSGGATANFGIYIDASDFNTITSNQITDSQCNTTCYAIDITSSSDDNYLSDNYMSDSDVDDDWSINDAGTGTIYGGQLDGSGNFVVNPSGTVELQSNTNVTGTLGVSGLTTLSGGLTVEAGDTITINGESFTDLSGDGLQITSNALRVRLDTTAADGSTTSSISGLELVGGELSLVRGCGNGEVLKWDNTNFEWDCAPDAGGAGVGDDVQVNGVDAAGADFLNVSASSTAVAVTWTLAPGPSPDTISLALGAASGSDAGIVTANAQTFGGNKTFNGTISAPGAGASSERFGAGATAAGANGVAIGNAASAGGVDSIALGRGASASGISGIAIGEGSTNTGSGIVIGDAASSNAGSTIVIGEGASVGNGAQNIVLGAASSIGNGINYGIAIGSSNTVTGSGGIAIGYGTSAAANQLVVGSNTSAISSAYFGNGVTNAAPSNFTLQGTGGSAVGVAGANFTLAAGAGTTTTTGSAGGALTLQGGNAGGSGNNNGGTTTVDAGSVTGSGTATLNLGNTNATVLNIGNNGSAVTLLGNGLTIGGGIDTITKTDTVLDFNLNGGGSNSIFTFTNSSAGLASLNVEGGATFGASVLIPAASGVDNLSPGIIAVAGDDFLYDGEYINQYGLGWHNYNDGGGAGLNAYLSGYSGIDLFTNGASSVRINNNGNVYIPRGDLTVGAAAFQGNFVLHDGDGETATITIDDVAANSTIRIPNAVSASDTFCLATLANCTGIGTSVDTTGTPAANQVAYFSDANTIQGSSNLTFNGTDVAFTGGFAGSINITSSLAAGNRNNDPILNITQANDAGNVFTGNFVNFTNSDTDSAGSVLNLTNAGSGLALEVRNNSTTAGAVTASFDASDNNSNGVLIDVQAKSNNRYALRVTSNNGGDPLIYARSDGAVGIGTETPNANSRLSVSMASVGTSAETLQGILNTVSGTGDIQSGTTTTVGQQINLTRNGITGTSTGIFNNTGLDISLTGDTDGTSTNTGLYVNVSGADTNYAAIFQGGNVGIGTATPTSLLHVSGTGGGGGLFRVTDTTATARDVLSIADGGVTTFRNQTDSTAAFQIQSAASGTDVFTVDTTNSMTQLRGNLSDATVGSELVSGQSCSGTNWTTGASFTHSTGSTVAATCTSPASVTSGATYRVAFTVAGNSTLSNTVTPTIGGIAGPALGANTTHIVVITTTGTTGLTFTPTSNFNGTVSATSVTLITNSRAALQVKNSANAVALEVRATTTANNSFVGMRSGQSNTTGGGNSAFGSGSLQSNTTGTVNSAVGNAALNSNTTGSQNSAVGNAALYSNTTGVSNTATGSGALYLNTTGGNNAALGSSALYANTTGSNNTALGGSAGYQDPTISQFVTGATLQNATMVGYGAQSQLSNSLILGGQVANQVNVGIGTTSPTNVLSVSPYQYYDDATTASQTTTTVTGTGTTFTSAMVGSEIVWADGNKATITAFNSTTSLTVTPSQTVTGQKFRIHYAGLQVTSAGNVGIGTVTPGTTLDVYSTANSEQLHVSRDDAYFYAGVTGSSGAARIGGYDASVGSLALLINETGGNVGIGSSGNPAYLLTVGNDLFGIQSNSNLIWEGTTADAFEMIVTVADPTADRTYTIPNSSAATDTFCLLTLNNCSGTATTLQASYTADVDGSDAVIALTSADGGVIIRDNATPLGSTLFAVQNSAGTSSYLGVTATGVTVAGTISVPGTGASSERFGAGSSAVGESLAVGANATVGSQYGVALGTSASVTGGNNSVAIGYIADTTGANSVAVGEDATATVNAVSIGQGTNSANSAVAIGFGTNAANNFSTAIGAGAATTGNDAIALGAGASAGTNQFVVNGVTSGYFGNGATAAAPYAFTLQGTGSSAAGTAGAAFTLKSGAGTTTGAGSSGGVLTLQAGDSGGANIAGGAVNLNGGRGTGTGVGGNIVFQYAPAGGAGSSLNALQTACSISGTNGSFSCPGAGGSILSERFGAGSSAAFDGALVVGNGATATNVYGIAIGTAASSNAYGIALGGSSSTTNVQAVAVGHSATADLSGVAVGYDSTATDSSIAVGRLANTTGSVLGTALGFQSIVNGNQGTAIGANSTAASFGIALGASTTAGANQFVVGSDAGGAISDAYFGEGVTNATPAAFTLRGTGSSVAGTAGAAFTLKSGAGTTTGAGSSGGVLTLQAGDSGGTNIAGAITNISGGRATGNAATGNIVFQYAPVGASGATLQTLQTACSISGTNGSLSCPGTGASSERFGSSTVASGTESLAVGNAATTSTFTHSTAIGKSASTTANFGTALGYLSASGEAGVALGAGASAVEGGTAIGQGATNGGRYTIAIGQNSSVSGGVNSGSIGIGNSASVAHDGVVALGHSATSTTDNQFIVGGSWNNGVSNGYFGNGVTAATPTAFTLQGTGGSVAGTAGAAFTLRAGAGTTTTTGSAGGDLTLQGGNAGGSGNNDGGDVYLAGGTATGSGVRGDLLLQQSGGNVGIGSTPGTNKLLVKQSAQGSSWGLRIVDSASSAGINLYQDGSGNQRLGFEDSFTVGNDSAMARSGTLQAGRDITIKTFNESTFGSIKFDVNGTEIARFDNAGNLGIGDTSPSARLEVGDGTDSLRVSSVGDLTFVDANGAATIQGPAGGALNIISGSTQNLVLNKNGGNLILSNIFCNGQPNGGALTTDGTGIVSCSADDGGSTTTLQQAYGNDADGSDAIIALTTADDSVIIRNPASSGTDSAFLLQADNLATGVTTNNFKNVNVTSAGSFNTTAGVLTNYGTYINNTSTRSAGANNLTNVGLYVNASGAQNNYAAIFQGGNVGIGTAAPAVQLHVETATGSGRQDLVRIMAGPNNTGNGATLALGSTQTVGGYIGGFQSAVNSGYLTLGAQSGSGYTEMARISATGFGIGTGSDVTYWLAQVKGDLAVIDSGSNPALIVGDDQNGGNYGGLRWNSASDYLGIGADASGNLNAIAILSSGNVGIGDTSADQLLEVLSSGAANTQLSIGNTNAGDFDAQIGFELADGTNSFTMGVDDSDSDKFKISTTGLGTNDRFVIDSSGNVAIGHSAPDEILHIAKATDGDQVLMLLENSQANSAASTNETAQLRFGFGSDNDVARILIGKESDYTSGANSDSFMDFYTDLNGTATLGMRLTSGGELKVATTAAVTLSGAKLLVTSAEVTTAIRFGTSTNGIDFNGNVSNKLRKAGSAREEETVSLNPEFIGAVFRGDGGTNVGYLTSDFCSGSSRINLNATECNTTETHNYYEWTHNETTDQDYDIVVRYRIPDDYDASAAHGTDITFRGFSSKSAASADNNVTLSLYNASGAQCGTSTNITNGTANQWGSGTIIGSTSGDTDCSTGITAGSYVTFVIHMTANSTGVTGEIVRMGAIEFLYKSTF